MKVTSHLQIGLRALLMEGTYPGTVNLNQPLQVGLRALLTEDAYPGTVNLAKNP